MALPTLSGTGRLTQDPELRFSASGVAVCTVNMAFNSRRQNKQTGNWEDGDVFYLRATAFNDLAEHIAETLNKGLEVVVTGRLKTDQWEAKDGTRRSSTAMTIDSIGPSLRYATANVNKAQRSTGGGYGSGGADDPWSSAPRVDDEPTF